jgi:hypothetical protein
MLLLLVIDIRKSHAKPREVHHEISNSRRHLGYVLEFFSTLLANISPAASGAYFYYIRTFVLKLSPLESKASGSFVSLPWFVGTFIGIFLGGQYNFSYAFALGV